ncbi:MAG TPA: protein kinase [Nonomuraea sp.]|nr:protein kinase [Nonomuraea sp.]
MVSPLTAGDPAELGPYRLAGRLGEGGQGVVYLAHGADGEPVAIKLLSAGDQATRARLARELSALEGIASFCTARVLDVAADGPRPYVVSEFVDGPSLADRVRERGPLRGGELERLVVGTATALAAIHAAGIVHRDFKPANVLLGPDGPRVVDFGIARAEEAATMTSGLIGTPAYLAPEQIGGSPASPASDVFAWAASMVYAATGVSPFGADTVPAVLHRVLHATPDLAPLPPRLRGLLASCLAKSPSARPSARQLMVSLVTPNAPLPRPAPPPPTAGAGSARDGNAPAGPQGPAVTTGPVRRSPSRGLVAGVAAVAVAVLAAGAAAAIMLGRAPATPLDDRTASAAPPATRTSAPDESSPGPTSAGPASTAPTSAESPSIRSPSGGPSDGGTPTRPGDASDLKIPAAFAGEWAGHTTSTNPLDSDGAENTVELEEGESTASWSEKDADDDCAGTITLTKVADTELTFQLGQNDGNCIAGTIWLRLRGDAVAYTWRDVPGPGLVTQTGTLTKK